MLTLLTEISKTLVTVQPLAQVLARVVNLVFGVLPAERAFLLLRDSIDEPLTARVMRNRDGSVPANPSLSRTIISRVMRERVAMLAKDAIYDPRLDASGSVHAMHIRSFMCAPLWNRNEVTGVLYCDNPRSTQFNADDLDVFSALCNYAAVAVEQARLSASCSRRRKRRERLQRYHSPGVISRIIHSQDAEGILVTQERDVSVMFCDIVGFTTLCQHLEPAAVGELLNTFFGRMCRGHLRARRHPRQVHRRCHPRGVRRAVRSAGPRRAVRGGRPGHEAAARRGEHAARTDDSRADCHQQRPSR